MAAKADTVIFHGGSISENVTRVMVYICTKFHASTYKPTILPHIYCTISGVGSADESEDGGAVDPAGAVKPGSSKFNLHITAL